MSAPNIVLLPKPGEVEVCCKHHRLASACCGKYSTRTERRADPLGLLAPRGPNASAPLICRIEHYGPIDCGDPTGCDPETWPGCAWCGHAWPCKKAGHIGPWSEHLWGRMPRALVLKWRGELVWPGLDQLQRTAPDGPKWIQAAAEACGGALPKLWRGKLPGTLFLLDAKLKDLSP